MFVPSLDTTTLTEPARTPEAELDHALQVFLAHRTRLFRVAYRVTGDVSSAEDVVQEAWLRWQRTDRRRIKNSAAFLTTTTTHLAINVIQSARHRHETPIESPLADLVDPAQDDPAMRVEQSAAVEQTLGLLMARLTPAQLAAYLLRRGFDYTYGDIAKLLRTTVPNARQLVRRAQPRIAGGREYAVDPEAHCLLVTAFLTAARTGDLKGMERLLTADGCPASGCSAVPPRRPTRRGHRSAPSRAA
jgi:RNA polymerase sigma-70 factor (ECF subfamily)